MVSQTDYAKYKAVDDFIIGPMTTIYQPPFHLREDAEAFKRMLDEYRKALGGFGRRALERGWRDVKESHSTWNWPHFQVIRDACMKHSTAEGVPNAEARASMPWKLKDDVAAKLAKDYLSEFAQSQIVARALQEGWASKLERYASASARYQAGAVAGCLNLGYSNAVYQWGNPGREDIERRRADFEAASRKQAATGKIEVTVPSEAIAAWKAEAA